MVNEVDSQAEAGLEPRLKTVPFSCFWIETSCEDWKVNGTGTGFTQRRSVYLFIYFSFFLFCFVFLGGEGGGGLATQFLITSYCVVHNPSSFLFLLSKKR